MNLQEAFLQAIYEAPEDDTPRLIYADWLEDNSDPERAEFIRLQIELSRIPLDDPRRPELERRKTQLRAAHQNAWLGELPAHLREVRFRRGFVDFVRLDLGYNAVGAAAKALCQSARLDRLHTLYLEGGRLAEVPLQRLRKHFGVRYSDDTSPSELSEPLE